MADLVMYLAVLPSYRSECILLLKKELPRLSLYVSSAHLDPTVRTGIDPDLYGEVKMHRLGTKLFVQSGHWTPALRAQALVVDLNPRSLTAWVMLVTRRALRRRTLVWGHLHPQRGRRSPTAFLRRTMRRLAHGTITYTYENRAAALSELPNQPVWTAPNSLYRRDQLVSPPSTATRHTFIYVGRFEPAKKVDFLVRAFAASGLSTEGAHLVLVGDGSQRDHLRKLVEELNLSDTATFTGWEGDFERLRSLYSEAVASCSPGFAGLGLTQSLGFGVPEIVALNEPHSPEIELARFGGVTWSRSDDPADFANAMRGLWAQRNSPREDFADPIRRLYSADAMASGLRDALLGMDDDGGK